jgi:hypothetical protein
MYDGRVGRWMTTDPYSQYHLPYLAMGNDPIRMIDPDGGFASSPLDDYELLKDGTINFLNKTDDDFDRLYNFDHSESIKIQKYIIGKYTYSELRNGLTYARTMAISDIEHAKEVFFWLANHSEVEFGLSIFQDSKIKDGSDKFAYISTTQKTPTSNAAQPHFEGQFLARHKTWSLIETWHNHPNVELGYSYRGPSGFYPSGRRDNSDHSDRRYYETMFNVKAFKGRTPEYFNLYDAFNKIYYMYNNKDFFKSNVF